MAETISRRGFLERAGLCATGFALSSCAPTAREGGDSGAGGAPRLPTRALGRTGLDVTILAFGAGSQFLRNEDGHWEPILERAVARGINLFDTASSYRFGASMSSEERLGRILPRYRNRILLSTKFDAREPEAAKREVEESLSKLKTDRVDILMLHSVEDSDDPGSIEKGVYREMVRWREQGVTRYIGFSSMNSAERSRDLLERLELDVVLLAMNPTKYGSFAQIALPAARSRGVGVLAMKVFRDIVGKDATPAELLGYAWSQEGVAAAAVGHFGPEVLEENLRIAADFGRGASATVDARALEERLAPLGGPHRLCWARAGYRDGGAC